MASSQTPIEPGAWAQVKNKLIRLAGSNLPAGMQIARWKHGAARRAGEKEKAALVRVTAQDIPDPGLILPHLRLSQPAQPELVSLPERRPSFAQLSETQRWVFLDWLERRERLPGLGYAYLYLYSLEAGLFDKQASGCCAEIQWLCSQCDDAAFQAQAVFDVALGAWLLGKAEVFEWAIERADWSRPHMACLLFWQIGLELSLSPRQLARLSPVCGYTPRLHQGPALDSCIQVSLKTLEENLQDNLLRHFAGQLASQVAPLEIRLANPAARFSLQTFDLLTHSPFRQAVGEVVSLADREAQTMDDVLPLDDSSSEAAPHQPAGGQAREWYIALEFGESSSEQFAQALKLAQKQSGYTRLLDEKRSLVHRVIFRRQHLPQFWKLLSLVRLWKSTRAYVNGQERDPAQLWPYSHLE